MGGFTYIGTLTDGSLGEPLGSAKLRVQEGEVIVQHDQLDTTVALALSSSTLASVSGEAAEDPGSWMTAEWFIGEMILLAASDIATVFENEGSNSLTIYGNQSGLYTDAVEALAVTVEGSDFLVMVSSDGYGIRTYKQSDGDLTRIQLMGDPDGAYNHGIAKLATLDLNGAQYVFSIGGEDSGVTAYTMNSIGRLSETSRIGQDQFLPIQTPTDLDAFTIAGTSFVLVASAGTSSLTLLELDENGTLIARDQVMDELNTRFQGVQVMEVFVRGDQAYVLVSGQDDGLSLFSITPDGRIFHRETIVDDTEMGLTNIADMEVVEIDGLYQILITSTVEPGVTQLSLNLGPDGEVRYAEGDTLSGTSRQDVLIADDGGTAIDGKFGDDILIDGAGFDQLTGGTSADIFVLGADGIRDEIMDFELGKDSLDLSSWGYLRDISQFSFLSTSDGVIISVGDESVRLFSANGASLSRADFTTNDLLNGAHVDLSYVASHSDTQVITGTSDDDILTGGDEGDELYGLAGDDVLTGGGGGDILDGGGGVDVADYSSAAQGVVADLGDHSENSGAAYGDLFSGIEGLSGSAFDDILTGDANENTLTGGAGDDVIIALDADDIVHGEDGVDWIDGGLGNDTLNGGAGNDALLGREGDDVIDGGAGDDNIAAHDGDDTVYGGDGDDSLGGSYGDDIMYGDAGNDTIGSGPDDDFIFAGDGDDVASGGWGSDDVRGGNGNDTLAGSYGTDIVYGEAGNDSLGGGTGNDTLWGGDGDDLIGAGDDDDYANGGNGNDFIGGGSGDDILRGGDGDDTLNGGTGDDSLHGGSESDIFVFNSFDVGEIDTITDFTIGEDAIRMKYVAGRFEGLEIENITLSGKNYAEITYEGHKIRLLDVDADHLSVTDFIFLG